MKKKIMQRALELAREGFKRFGGKVKEYFSLSLRMAWAESKEMKTLQLEQVKFEAKVFTLPNLKGSEKQIAWANDIMTAAFTAITNYTSKEVNSLNRRIASSNANPDKITPETVAKVNAYAKAILNGYAVMFEMYQAWFNAHPKAWTIISHKDEWCKPSTIRRDTLQHYATMTVKEALSEKEARIDKKMSSVYGTNWKVTENY